ncbi:alpha/beta hydrolase [Aureimonas jatrophae]|uniref:Palmitoyl-protein thioesterase ABHD10, mitochondrial n=1 Tax=Aureimonas jatrophae TaxID=1166073 RepID=A0A1H0CA51_9HYPH|nr:alpha/beta hydrolase [Aureimonas jatrophae]MBB3949138.1 pimeloyl-ACP methyl ester carboxylesterase [Aureimonas jatrophae]SDN54732.1 Lysophospholipase, alpha-beta hydrolase superfamily [Aureimonas jatrophae]
MPDASRSAGLLRRDSQPALAYARWTGRGPTLVWLGGLRSDMTGTKAEALDALASREGFGFLRFDYRGHGTSEGRFEDGTITLWTEDAREAIAALAPEGPVILAGSSMGAWIALGLVGPLRTEGRNPAVALLLLAPAPDFTTRLVEPNLTDTQRRELEETGRFVEPSPYGEGMVYTRELIEDGRAAAVMTGPIDLGGVPVRIIQGMEDREVPPSHALDLAALLPSENVTMTLVPGGDHRLSEPEDLQRMEQAVLDLLKEVAALA